MLIEKHSNRPIKTKGGIVKKLLIIILVILSLPICAYIGLYLYGTYLITDIKQQQKKIDKKQEQIIQGGNGFGGEAGFEVVDSEYSSDRYFWLDKDTLIFYKKFHANDLPNIKRAFVWDLVTGEIKPVQKEGGVNCFHEGYMYYSEFTGEIDARGNKKVRRFQSKLTNNQGEWFLEDSIDIQQIWPLPSERYTLEWTEQCKPWFRLKTALRTEEDVPEHRFEYLPEWGWIIRMPRLGPEHFDQAVPEMGVFDISDEVYAGQQGVKVTALPDINPADWPSIEISYLEFMDKYWLATWVFGQEGKQKYLSFLNKDGTYQTIEWIKNWKLYDITPIPSRKGLIWAGYDYRLPKISRYEQGGFIKLDDVHKFVHGNNNKYVISPDGCRVAFGNQPKYEKGYNSLKVFNVCNSKINGKALEDFNY